MDAKPKAVKFKPIATRKIYQYILEQFVNMICIGSIKPGDKIPSERELAQSFKVSRPSVREALRVLEIIGLIDIQPGGGAYLKEMELAPFISVIAPLLFSRGNFDLELLEFRELIELRAMELLPGQLTDEDLGAIGNALTAMETAYQNNDPEAGALADIGFHRSLLTASKSFILQKVLELVVSLFEHAVRGGRSQVLEKKEDARQLLLEHQNIYEALAKNDFTLAHDLLRSHLDMVRKLYSSNSNR
jgi:GntR family transcriptional repressor for pyruvate dehydrogenase complex